MSARSGSSSTSKVDKSIADTNFDIVQFADMSTMNLNSSKPVAMNLSELDKLVANSKKPVVVDFWAPWCKPCNMMAPVFEKLSKEMSDHLVFAKINVQEHQDAARKYQIKGIPLFLIFKDGKIDKRIIGYKDEKEFKNFLAEYTEKIEKLTST